MNGFIIHQRKFKETSLFLELFTRCRGRLSVLAKGAYRPKSTLGSELQPLRLLDFTLHERSTIPILKSVDLIENYYINIGSKMFSIFYINELIYKGLLNPALRIFLMMYLRKSQYNFQTSISNPYYTSYQIHMEQLVHRWQSLHF